MSLQLVKNLLIIVDFRVVSTMKVRSTSKSEMLDNWVMIALVVCKQHIDVYANIGRINYGETASKINKGI